MDSLVVKERGQGNKERTFDLDKSLVAPSFTTKYKSLNINSRY